MVRRSGWGTKKSKIAFLLEFDESHAFYTLNQLNSGMMHLQKTTLLKGLDNWRIFSLRSQKGKRFVERVAAE